MLPYVQGTYFISNISKHVTKPIRGQYITESEVENNKRNISEKNLSLCTTRYSCSFLVLKDTFIFLNFPLANS